MTEKITVSAYYKISDKIVVREIDGELIIIPIASGIGKSEDDLYSLNETGKAILDKLDGKHSVKEIVNALSSEYKGSVQEIEKDVVGVMTEMLKRNIVAKVGKK